MKYGKKNNHVAIKTSGTLEKLRCSLSSEFLATL